MKNLIFLITLTVSGQALAQPTLQQLSRSTLPAGIRYSGNIKNAVSWTDSSGHHIVVTTETGAYESRNDVSGGSDAELFAYHYIKSGDSLKLTWKLYDHIKDCPVDIVAAFVKNTFAVTDLDKNGQAEIWLMYKTVCRGDVSPCNMKIIMFENNRKHAMRGRNKVHLGADQYLGGEYSYDNAFKKAPAVFRYYAERLWKANILEKWEEQ